MMTTLKFWNDRLIAVKENYLELNEGNPETFPMPSVVTHSWSVDLLDDHLGGTDQMFSAHEDYEAMHGKIDRDAFNASYEAFKKDLPFQRLIDNYMPNHPHITAGDVRSWCDNRAENEAETFIDSCLDCDACNNGEEDECIWVVNSAMERLKRGDVTHEDLVFEALDELGGSIDHYKDELEWMASTRIHDDMPDVGQKLLRYILTNIVDNEDIDLRPMAKIDRDAIVSAIEGYYDSVGVEDFLENYDRDLWLSADDVWHSGNLDLVSEQSVQMYKAILDDIRTLRITGHVSTSEEMTEELVKGYDRLIGKTMRVVRTSILPTVVWATINEIDTTSFGPHPVEKNVRGCIRAGVDFEGCDNLIEVYAYCERIGAVGVWMVNVATIMEQFES